MSSTTPADAPSAEVKCLRENWFLMLLLGVLLMIVGMVAISSSFIATLATVVMVGTLLMIGGVVEVVEAFWARQWRGFLMHMLGGILYMVLGFLLIQRPLAAAVFFTLMISAALFVGGLSRIIFALSERFYGWVWVLLNGVISLVLGIMIWQEWPEATFWVIGLFVGIDMLFAGWSMVITALAAHSGEAKPV